MNASNLNHIRTAWIHVFGTGIMSGMTVALSSELACEG